MHPFRVGWLLGCLAPLFACSDGGSGGGNPAPPAGTKSIVVNSLLDAATPPAGTVTLRSALESAASGQPITFDPQLNGGTVALTLVADEHTSLKGEVMGMRDEPSGPVSYLVGYLPRDYGASALVARKAVVIDASALPSGITLAWTGGGDARVLAVDGDLTLSNVAITGGRSVAVSIAAATAGGQPWTLGRGAALAVWGVAKLTNCRLYDNHARGDFDSSRDRGAFGGAVYADIVEMHGCVVTGNTVTGAGAAGGGVYSVGGAGSKLTASTIDRSAITGNRISGLFAYGAGVYSDGGGIGESKLLRVTNTTVARNLAEPAPGLPPFLLAMGYWRGGGVYVSNGHLELMASTVVENAVRGVPRTDSLGRRNLAGGIAATVGNAHAVESMTLGHSIVAGNTVEEIGGRRYAHDVFTGSLMHFLSAGYNRFGVLDFDQILVPVGEPTWESLVRRHCPKQGDTSGVDLASVVDLAGGVSHASWANSAGVGSGEPAVLAYLPRGTALDVVPAGEYPVEITIGEYSVSPGATDDFLRIVLGRIETRYGLPGFAAAFKADFEAFLRAADSDSATAGAQPYRNPSGSPILSLADTHWFGPNATWPRELANYPYIEFWHRLDTALEQRAIPGLGMELLGDDAWQSLFQAGHLTENPGIRMTLLNRRELVVKRGATDQLGTARPTGLPGDIGAVESR
jgi:hypothetical protein